MGFEPKRSNSSFNCILTKLVLNQWDYLQCLRSHYSPTKWINGPPWDLQLEFPFMTVSWEQSHLSQRDSLSKGSPDLSWLISQNHMRRLANYTFQGCLDRPHMVAQSAQVATWNSDGSKWLRNAGWKWSVNRLLIWLKLMWFRWLYLWDVGYGIISCKFWHRFRGSRQGAGTNFPWLVEDGVAGNTRATEDSSEPAAELTGVSVLSVSILFLQQLAAGLIRIFSPHSCYVHTLQQMTPFSFSLPP